MRVMNGVKAIAMACEAAVPLATVSTLRTNGRLLKLKIF